MKLEIIEDKLIKDVQADFNHWFPYLKLEFFLGQKHPTKTIPMLKADCRIGDVTYGLQEGNIQLSDAMTVIELEEIFNDRFGLHIQVFRKSGNTWLETTMTDKWTLKLQNDHGREISAALLEPYKGLPD